MASELVPLIKMSCGHENTTLEAVGRLYYHISAVPHGTNIGTADRLGTVSAAWTQQAGWRVDHRRN